jgi:hypothetical protein
MYFRSKIFLSLIPILLGAKLLSITTEEFTSGILKEDLNGPIVGNQYFQYEVPNGYSYFGLPVIDPVLLVSYSNESYLEQFSISVQLGDTKLDSFQGIDPLVGEFERLKDLNSFNHSEGISLVTVEGYKGFKWNDTAPVSNIQYNNILLQPVPSYQIVKNGNLDVYLFVYIKSNLPMSEVEDYANKFKLKDGSGSSGARQPKEIFNGTDIGSNWVNSWFGTVWIGSGNNWVFHIQLGWVYVAPSDDDSNWIYINDLKGSEKWVWLKADVFPYMYHYKSNSSIWLHLSLNSSVLKKFLNNSWIDSGETSLPLIKQNTQEDSWDQQYAKWIKNPEPYGGVEALEAIKQAKKNEVTRFSVGRFDGGEYFLDITPLKFLKSLEWLDASGANIKDITPLASLENLDSLFLNSCEVEDFTPIAGLSKLTTLEIWNNPSNDISFISELSQLVHLSPFEFSDVSPLANLSNLTSLGLSKDVHDLSPIFHLKNLVLWLSVDEEFSVFESLSNFTNLKELHIHGTNIKVSEKNILETKLPKTTIFWPDDLLDDVWDEKYENWLKNPEPYGGLDVLEKIKYAKDNKSTELSLDGTNISDLTPLAELTHLRWLYLNDCKNLNFEQLIELPILENLTDMPLGNTNLTSGQRSLINQKYPHLRLWDQGK